MEKQHGKANQSICEISKHFGYGKNHFHIIKLKSPERYNYINSLEPDDLKVAYQKYLDEMDDLKFKIQDIYYYLEDHRLISQFGRFLKEKKVFKHPNSLNNTFMRTIFRTKPGFSFHKTYLRYQQIPQLFKEFKEVHK